jgi:hypothetical protein
VSFFEALAGLTGARGRRRQREGERERESERQTDSEGEGGVRGRRFFLLSLLLSLVEKKRGGELQCE